MAVRNLANLQHLRRTLQKTNLRRNDIVVMTVRPGADSEYALNESNCSARIRESPFFRGCHDGRKGGQACGTAGRTRDGSIRCPRANGKPVEGLPTGHRRFPSHVFGRVGSEDRPCLGASSRATAFILVEIITPDRPSTYVNLGPHPPRLWPEDVDKLHDLWLRLSADEALGAKLHHRDVVGLALRKLEQELQSPERDQVIRRLSEELGRH